MLISEELIRVAILWHEIWHDGLEEASRLYFGEKNVKGMLAALQPLHQMLERGPQTLKETSFNQVRMLMSVCYETVGDNENVCRLTHGSWVRRMNGVRNINARTM